MIPWNEMEQICMMLQSIIFGKNYSLESLL